MRKVIITLLTVTSCLFANSVNKTLNNYKLSHPPVVDGVVSDWGSNWINIDQIMPGNTTSQCFAKFQIGYTNDSLYVVIKVEDVTPNNDLSITGSWLRDCVELFVKLDTVTMLDGVNGDTQYRLQRDASLLETGGVMVNAKSISTSTGYTQEWALPWSGIATREGYNLNITTLKDARFEIQVADNTDGTSIRTEQLFWNAATDTQYGSMTDLGFMKLMGLQTAVSTVMKDENINVYFNSNKDALTISKYIGELCVYDALGKLVLKTIVNSNSQNINMNSINRGIYFVSGSGFSSKFIK